ncbi:MAG: sigma-70 family RNA polymerase sigma factor [Gemmatimonadaceae bacterium]|nr:sigma-70 family RNA polymerase sigma factor [Gemmatimonadaceae bacterium]
MRQTAGGGRAPRLVLVPGGQAGGAAFVREEPVNAVDDSVTGLVRAWSAGDAMAGDRLFSRVYGELRAIARRLHRDPGNAGDPTLDTTALVHEVYLRMAGSDALEVVDRAHFFAVAVRASRQVLSNYVRDAQALKRGGVAVPMPLEGVAEHELAAADHETARIERAAMLEEALTALEALHPRPCRVVECRYFGGLSIPETALALDISEATVKRDWVVAQAWLHRALRDSPPRDDDAR